MKLKHKTFQRLLVAKEEALFLGITKTASHIDKLLETVEVDDSKVTFDKVKDDVTAAVYQAFAAALDFYGQSAEFDRIEAEVDAVADEILESCRIMCDADVGDEPELPGEKKASWEYEYENKKNT